MNSNIFYVEFIREDELVPVELLNGGGFSAEDSSQVITDGQVCF